MSTYIMLANWTEQGAQKIKESPRRLELGEEGACRYGG